MRLASGHGVLGEISYRENPQGVLKMIQYAKYDNEEKENNPNSIKYGKNYAWKSSDDALIVTSNRTPKGNDYLVAETGTMNVNMMTTSSKLVKDVIDLVVSSGQ